jgi:DNA polymerase I-like protein with 3'-5' exonuclease and polymerase domains
MRVRSLHSALNTLLQGAGAQVMKKALVILDGALQSQFNLIPGRDYEFVANVHDEWQIESDPAYSDVIGRAGVEAIRLAGIAFNLRCPLSGEYKIGKNWADTH